MIKAIFYKEWIKCRALISLLALIAVALVVYLFIDNANLLRTSSAVAIWSQLAEGGISLFSIYIKMFMPLAALSISVMQYSLEMANKRLKLTLHLPCSEAKIVGAMQLFGVSMVMGLYAMILVPSYLGLSLFYPSELVVAMFISIIPYALAGVASYFFVMWIIVEPIWRRRAIYLLISAVLLVPFMFNAMLGATIYMLPFLVLIVGGSIASAYYSAARFKDGAQN